jgi:hypothetical protein
MEVYLSENAFVGLLVSTVEVYRRECFGILLGHLTAVYCLIEKRQHLRAKKRRGQHVMSVGNHGLVAS